MTKASMYFFNTPVLDHSSAPEPRLSRTFGSINISFLLVIVLKLYD
jgi:hypothetical protein